MEREENGQSQRRRRKSVWDISPRIYFEMKSRRHEDYEEMLDLLTGMNGTVTLSGGDSTFLAVVNNFFKEQLELLKDVLEQTDFLVEKVIEDRFGRLTVHIGRKF